MSYYDDRLAAAYYADPAHRQTRGPATSGSNKLSSIVQVRFHPDTVDLMRQIAYAEGITVAEWMRHLVQNELERRTEK